MFATLHSISLGSQTIQTVSLLPENRSEVIGLFGWDMGLFLLWCSHYASSHLPPSPGTVQSYCEITGQTSETAVVCESVYMFMFRGRSHQCVSWPCCTFETPSPLTWSWRRLCPDHEPVCLPPSSRCFWCYRYAWAASILFSKSS